MQNYSIHRKQAALSESQPTQYAKGSKPQEIQLTQYNRELEINMFKLIKDTKGEKKTKKNTQEEKQF